MHATWLERLTRGSRTAGAAAVLILVGFGPAKAQQGTITGRVVDQSSLSPLAEAQVFVVGTKLGTLTDAKGNYRITDVPAGLHTVRVRLIGYRSDVQSVTVESNRPATADFELTIAAVSLQEVVVTAIGSRPRRSLGTNISTIDVASEVQKTSGADIQDVLQGQTPGVTVLSVSGSVGAATGLRVRGPSTISLPSEPLLYIDGVRVSNDNAAVGGGSGSFYTGGQQTSRWSDLNPRDIQSLEVLRGPAAVTLYGTGAAGGVILVTTKHGASSRTTRYSARAEVGGNWDASGSNFQTLAYNPTDNPNLGASFFENPANLGYGFVPKDTVYLMNLMTGAPGIAPPFRTGLMNTYSGNVRGSAAPFTYYFSGQYQSEQGDVASNGVTRWNGRANFSAHPSDKVNLDVSTGFTSNNTLLPQNDDNGLGYVGNAVLGRGFWLPMNRADPVHGGAPIRTCPLAFEAARNNSVNAEFGGLAGASQALCGSPFFSLSFQDVGLLPVRNDVQRFTGSSTLIYRPKGFWTNRFLVGYDEYSSRNLWIFPVVPRLQSAYSEFAGSVDKEFGHHQVLTLEAISSVAASPMPDLTSTTSIGAQFVDTRSEAALAEGQVFPASSPSVGSSTTTLGSDSFSEVKALGIFAQQRFGWRDRLYVSGGVRMDENSSFGPKLGLKAVPQFSVAYVLSEESWFPKLFDQFKVRGAWGKSTKQPPTNAALALLTPLPVVIGGAEQLGVTANRPGNDSLKPETDTELELGADFSLLHGRLSGSFTWYHDVNRDVIVQRPLPPSSGYPNPEWANVGELANTGFEAQVNATAFDLPDLRWEWTIGMATNYNKITKLPNPIQEGFGQRLQQGYELGSYFARPVTLVNGVPTVADAPQVLNAAPTPNLTGSLASTMTLFRHVTLYGLADFASGNQLVNATRDFVCGFVFNRCPEVFQLDGAGNFTDRARILRFASPSGVNSIAPYVENASFVKLRTVSLRVDLPSRWVRPFGAQGLSVTVVGNNLMTWTGYSGVDPEVDANGGGAASQGLQADFLSLPPARSVTAAVSVTF